jgi:hypothetical protein
MNERDATAWASRVGEQRAAEQGGIILQVGSRVRVTSYGPFRGLRGTIRNVDTIPSDLEELFCFYLVTLEGAYIKEPIWFEYHEVEVVTHP